MAQLFSGEIDDLSEAELRKLIAKPIIKTTDMPQEMAQEAKEIVTSGIDKFINTKNWEVILYDK